MKAMILAAGFGTRLRPLTNTIPKPLLPVGGMPLIVWNLLLLRVFGIRQVMVNLHYMGHLIREALGDGTQWDMEISYSLEPEILGTGGGLKAAARFFEGQPFLIINGDIIIDLDVQAVVDFHCQRKGMATLVLRDDPDVDRWGSVECDANQQILRINGRGKSTLLSEFQVFRRMFTGVHIIDPELLHAEQEGVAFSIIDTYTRSLAHGYNLFGFVHAGYWSDVGTPERYRQAQADAESGKFLVVSRKLSRYT